MSEAAHFLHLTPQALSASIKALEKELGFKLLQTTFRGSTLTPKGEQVVELAQKFLADLDALRESSSLEDHQAQTLLLPTSPGIINWYLELLYHYIQQQNLTMTVDFTAYPTAALLTKIQNQELPYGFVYQNFLNGEPIPQHEQLTFNAIITLPVVILAHKEHPLAHYKGVTLKTVFKYPMIMMEGSECMLQDLFAQYGTPPKIHLVPSASVFKPTLENNAGVLMTYNNSPLLHVQNVVQIHLRTNLTSAFGLIHHSDYAFSPKQEADIAFLTDFFQLYFDENCMF